MIAHDTIPFRAILAIAGQHRGVDVERCRVVLELLSTATSVRSAFRHELEALKLSELDFAALVTLYAIAPERSTLANVAAQTSSTRPSMTEAADRLEARALLRRQRDTTDRRVVFVELTEAGRKVAEQGLGMMVEKANRIGRAVGPNVDATIVEACRRLDEAARRERKAG
jgi:DNA-binding MarR family transcriptional regulator